MTSLTKESNLLPFLFMGCWNEDDTPRASVAKAIRENPIKTLVLGGDNVYPQKLRIGNATDFTKVYSLKTLMDGVRMLHGKEIYTALGNHNVGGPMLKTELSLKEWTLPDRYYSVHFSDCSLVIIDSNLVEDDSEYTKMREWLVNTINELKRTGKPYYYVQHEPFISFKKKKVQMLDKLSDLLRVLTIYPPIAILCADTHNFQQGTLQVSGVSIPQYVVGTGGAHPDFLKAKDGDKYEVDGITYTIDKSVTGYGYLEVTGDDIKFIKVEDWRPFEGKGGNRKHPLRTHKKRKGKRYARKTTRKI
jgi:hypothetical protein